MLLVVTALVPLATFAWKTIQENRDALTTMEQARQLQIASHISRTVDIYIDGFCRHLVGLSEAFAAGRRAEGASRFLRRLSRGGLGRFIDDDLVALRLVPDRGGEIRAVTGGLTLPEAAEPVLEDGAEWVRGSGLAALQAEVREAYVSDPVLLGPAGVLCVVISTPIVDQGRAVGLLQGVLVLENLWSRVVREDRSGRVLFGVAPSGGLFAHTDKSLVLRGEDMSDLEVVRRYLAGGGRSAETLIYTREDEAGPTDFLASYETTRRGWGVFVQVEKRLAYSPARKIVGHTSTWAIVALLVAIVVAVVFAGTLTRPLQRLAEASRRFAKGDFHVKAEISAGNEIGELAETFNAMVTSIQDYIEKIKEAARQNNQIFLGIIRSLAEAIDEKDAYTKGHSVRVNRYAVIVGRHLGLSSDEMRALHVSSLLHDVGKIGIEDKILKKPGALDEAEYAVMKTHPERGYKIMGQIPHMENIIPGMRFHHERWNGKGYPLGLKGEEIPLQAAIVAIADTFDAMTTHRPYQKAMTFEQAVARVNELKDVTFAPKVVEAFNRAYEAGDLELARTAVLPPGDEDFEEGEVATPEELEAARIAEA
jgi:HD-GYP domain-containing protein (c-di-GMP phosphodiesterase class II)